jgi:predicted amidohydrolase YtcJ
LKTFFSQDRNFQPQWKKYERCGKSSGKKRWPFRIHATYNESITRFLNVIEEVNKETPLNGLVWFIDHAETVSEQNMKRIKAMGGGIAVQHRMAYQGKALFTDMVKSRP